eukprot:513654-Pleurochrysis_carterae.AAC.2
MRLPVSINVEYFDMYILLARPLLATSIYNSYGSQPVFIIVRASTLVLHGRGVRKGNFLPWEAVPPRPLYAGPITCESKLLATRYVIILLPLPSRGFLW